MPKNETFRGPCIDSAAQLTVIDQGQAKVYCPEYSVRIGQYKPRQSYHFGDSRYVSVGTLKIRIPLENSLFIDVTADVVDVSVTFPLGLDTLTSVQVIFDIIKDIIMHPTAG